MKKFFAVLGCVLGFALLVTLCYFFVNPADARMFEGKYYLYLKIETNYTDENNPVETKTHFDFDEEKSWELKGQGVIETKNVLELTFEEGKDYLYSIVGTKFKITLDNKAVYEGYFAEGEIVVIVDDEDNHIAYEYYFKKI